MKMQKCWIGFDHQIIFSNVNKESSIYVLFSECHLFLHFFCFDEVKEPRRRVFLADFDYLIESSRCQVWYPIKARSVVIWNLLKYWEVGDTDSSILMTLNYFLPLF